jgi:hypothetical protein
VELALRYPFASHEERGWGVRLAGAMRTEDDAAYFEGPLEQPRELADMLLVLARIARSRFFMPAAARDLDPIVTSGSDTLRFEAFSSDNGVYARVDVQGQAVARATERHGTTHVDFNDAIRKALTAVVPGAPMHMHIAGSGLTLVTADARVHEKRVTLSKRWIRGLCEVQSHQHALAPAFEISGGEALRFVRGLRADQPWLRGSLCAEPRLRMVFPAREGEVAVAGAQRLRALEPALTPERRVAVWRGDDDVCAWEVIGRGARLWVVLSADARHGFSGDGQLLEVLSRRGWLHALPVVRARLRWQSRLDANALAAETQCDERAVTSALAALATQGLVGFDARAGAYFHRELPFAVDAIDALQPRLEAARRLVAAVRVLDHAEALVPATGVNHHVRTRDGVDGCTCRWHARHRGRRGPCKHILAVRMARELSATPPPACVE